MMKTKISKAQLEVWEWKEELQEQIKNLPKGEQIRFIQNQTAQTIQELLAKRQKQTK